jgi:hypothetical protein
MPVAAFANHGHLFQQRRREPGKFELEPAVAIDAARHAILLAIDHPAVTTCEPAVIEGAHGANLAVNARFTAFKPESLAARELTLADTCRDAVLLVDLALCNVVKAVRRLRLADGRSTKN